MTEIHSKVQDWIIKEGLGSIQRIEQVGGGCIHQALRIYAESGESFFLKQKPGKYKDIFLREADGLRALRIEGGPIIPRVYIAGEDYLLLEDLRPAAERKDFWLLYGQQLGRLHLEQKPRFGFDQDNYIGANPQLNGWMDDGYTFFRDQRLRPQIRWAESNGLLDSKDLHRLDDLVLRLSDLIPAQPASLLHGDLWSGNLITDREGNPALIDPAVYYGWAEADLAMTDLFGRYPDAFYQAYREINSLEDGFRGRFPLYNLYHLLNHLNLFGRGYLSRVREVINRYL